MKNIELKIDIKDSTFASVFSGDDKIAYIKFNQDIVFIKEIENKRKVHFYIKQYLLKDLLKKKKEIYKQRITDYKNINYKNNENIIECYSNNDLIARFDLIKKDIIFLKQDISYDLKKEIIAFILFKEKLIDNKWNYSKDFISEIYLKNNNLDFIKQIDEVPLPSYYDLILLSLDYQFDKKETELLMKYVISNDMQTCLFIIDSIILQDKSVDEIKIIIEDNKQLIDSMNYVDLLDFENYEFEKPDLKFLKVESNELQKSDIRVKEFEEIEKTNLDQIISSGIVND